MRLRASIAHPSRLRAHPPHITVTATPHRSRRIDIAAPRCRISLLHGAPASAATAVGGRRVQFYCNCIPVGANSACVRAFAPALTHSSASAYQHFQLTRDFGRSTYDQWAHTHPRHGQSLISRAGRSRSLAHLNLSFATGCVVLSTCTLHLQSLIIQAFPFSAKPIVSLRPVRTAARLRRLVSIGRMHACGSNSE